MVEVKGKPILAHQVDWLKQGGVTHVVMLCGYRGDVVADYFGEGEAFGVAISYSFEDEPLGRGGALRQGYEQVPRTEDTIVALNGDILTHQPLAEIIERHRATGAVGTIMLTHPTSSFGIVNVEDDDRITAFAEKPVLPYWINAGIYVLGPEFFQRLPEKGDHEESTFPDLAAERKLFGFKTTAYWRAIDSVKELTEAEREFGQVTRT